MKSLFLAFLFIAVSFNSYGASVIKADANNIQDDLNFKLQSTPKEYHRSLASEKKNSNVNKEAIEVVDDKKDNNPETKRDIANQPQEDQSDIKYWSY